MMVILLGLIGCAETGVQTAEKQANSASKSKPIIVPITTPFDAAQAKAALAQGDYHVSGVMYHRLTVSGREDKSWPKDPNIKNVPLRNMDVYLYPETAHLADFDKQIKQQQKIMENWYTNTRNVFNKQPQTKLFPLSAEAIKLSLKTTTDEFGRYRFEHLKPGRYYLTASAWQAGTYNQSVYAGSSEVTDGTGIYGERATVDHTKLVPVNYNTYLIYVEPVNASKNNSLIDSRMRVDYNEMSIQYD
ncbi:MAG TPA: carboxypeptidase-like regulatory domain-containing protein [Methylotenera sp.]|nr:carboxypeptidase-like regulatory domain-containing protein [Methylotenera sp.]HPH04259.1 carboxypeptidase-like regulatory domain-containing protein [Methylotenera sp.]HPM99813.1 carboxypeptidase-like regulatory domain-containing protein [Methylotenera sp.]